MLDQAPLGDSGQSVNSWASYWTGWRPIEWAFGVVNGEERIFFGSVDYDGKNRVWELGSESKSDNGVPITCSATTREYLFGNRDYKKFDYAEIELKNISGEASVASFVAGNRGGWVQVGKKEIASTIGQVYGSSQYGYNAHQFAGYSPQTRVIRTSGERGLDACNSTCVESNLAALIDKSFSMMIVWSGDLAINAIRVFAEPYTNHYNGNCEEQEEGPNLLNDFGCGINGLFTVTHPFDYFEAAAIYRTKVPCTGEPVSAKRIAHSIISKQDAERKAYLAAKNYVQSYVDSVQCEALDSNQ